MRARHGGDSEGAGLGERPAALAVCLGVGRGFIPDPALPPWGAPYPPPPHPSHASPRSPPQPTPALPPGLGFAHRLPPAPGHAFAPSGDQISQSSVKGMGCRVAPRDTRSWRLKILTSGQGSGRHSPFTCLGTEAAQRAGGADGPTGPWGGLAAGPGPQQRGDGS